MKIEELKLFSPQQVFLIQGNEASFNELVASVLVLNPYASALSLSRFTVDDAADVVAFNGEGNGTERYYLLYFSVFSPEAAQALLKTLEEPERTTTIIFVTPYPYMVPMTIRSRALMISGESKKEKVSDVKTIISKIKTEAENKDDEPAVRRAAALLLLDELEQSLSQKPEQALSIYKAKQMILRANLPTKFVLDYVSTVI